MPLPLSVRELRTLGASSATERTRSASLLTV